MQNHSTILEIKDFILEKCFANCASIIRNGFKLNLASAASLTGLKYAWCIYSFAQKSVKNPTKFSACSAISLKGITINAKFFQIMTSCRSKLLCHNVEIFQKLKFDLIQTNWKFESSTSKSFIMNRKFDLCTIREKFS